VRVAPAIIKELTAGGATDEVSVTNVEGTAPFTTTASPVGEREIACPSTVKTPPGVKVWLPITRSDCEFCVKVEEPTTKIGADVVVAVIGPELDGRANVMTSSPVVMAAPGKRVSFPITKPDAELAVMLEPATITMAGAGVELGALPELDVSIAPLTMTAPPELTDITSPLIVAADPGVKVWEPIIKAEDGPWLTVNEPINMAAGGVVELSAEAGVLARACVLEPIAVDAPFEARGTVAGPVSEGREVVPWAKLVPGALPLTVVGIALGLDSGIIMPVPDCDLLGTGSGLDKVSGMLDAGRGLPVLHTGHGLLTGGGLLHTGHGLLDTGGGLLGRGGSTTEIVGMKKLVGSFCGVEEAIKGALVNGLWTPMVGSGGEVDDRPVVGNGIPILNSVGTVVGDCMPVVVVPELEPGQSTKPPRHPIIPPSPVDVELELLSVVGGAGFWLEKDVMGWIGGMVTVFCIRLDSGARPSVKTPAGPTGEI
jgi:hypothetical protein